MSGGSQHNPNGRQAQLGPGWSPLQLQVANFLARAPQAHMASERGVTWHTPTPPPHLYHVPAPSPPDPLQGLLQLQAMKGANSVFRHTATPPELYRHTPTPPDKHLLRHTPSPGDVKASTALPPAELYPHLGPGREKMRPEELLAYARGAATGAVAAGAGVDLSTGARGSANGAPAHSPHPPHPSPALSVRDAPTINSLIARAQPRHGVGRVDALLERLVPSPASPHSVIVLPRAAPTPPTPPAGPTPSPPSSNEDSADSCGAPPGSKRKRKPDRTIRVSAPLSRAPSSPVPPALPCMPLPPPAARLSPPKEEPPVENGVPAHEKINGSEPKTKENPHGAPNPPNPPDPPRNTPPQPTSPPPLEPHARRKTRANSAETIDDIAAMVAAPAPRAEPLVDSDDAPDSIDKLESVLASPHRDDKATVEPDVSKSPHKSDDRDEEKPAEPQVEVAAAPKRRSARTSNAEANVPVESPSEAKPAEGEAGEARTAEPTAASFVEVENQLEKMFAGIEEEPAAAGSEGDKAAEPRKRRRSAPAKGEAKAGRRKSRAATNDERRKGTRNKSQAKRKPKEAKDAYDSGSNASSSRSRGPYIQIRGPRDSPLSVSVINASTGEEEGESVRARKGEFRNGLRARGLHASTLGLRYDATTPDATWLCAFCGRGPHAKGLGDLFGPYAADTDCEEYRALDEAARRQSAEAWFHEACGVWAPGLLASGARVWGLAAAVWGARGASCSLCARAGAQVACATRGCRLKVHVPCAAGWRLQEDDFRAFCPRHA